MKDILRTLKLVDAMEKKKKRKLNETAVAECGEMGSPAPAVENPGNPVTASITLNASGMEHVADLMRLMQQAGLEKSGPVAPEQMPIRADMERLRDKMNGLEAPVADGSISSDIRNSGIEEWENEPDEEYGDHLEMIKRLSGGINGEKTMHKPASQGDNAMAVEASPKAADGDEGSFYDDESGLHIEWQIYDGEIEVTAYDDQENEVELDPRQAQIYVSQVQDEFRDAQDEYGDYEMRRRNDETVLSVKSRLLKALSEKKAKPDFLDVDKDGDTKEPFKKALADKKSKKKDKIKESADGGTTALLMMEYQAINSGKGKKYFIVNHTGNESFKLFLRNHPLINKLRDEGYVGPRQIAGWRGDIDDAIAQASGEADSYKDKAKEFPTQYYGNLEKVKQLELAKKIIASGKLIK